MEELKKELEKLSKAYVDTPENEEKILIPFIKRLFCDYKIKATPHMQMFTAKLRFS